MISIVKYNIAYITNIWYTLPDSFVMFWKKYLMLVEAALFVQKYSKNSKILLQFKITVFYLNTFKTRIYSCDVKADFQQQVLLHSSVSNDPLEIDTRDTFLFIINVENSFVS